MRRIAVWNTAFLGDAVLSLPLVQSLYNAFPDARIDYYVREGLSPLFACHPALSGIYALSRQQRSLQHLPGLRRELRQRDYDLWVCAHTGLRSGCIALLSGAERRVGYRETPGSSVFFTHRTSRNFYGREEVERLLGLLEPLGVPVTSRHPELTLPQEALQAAESYFAPFDGPVLGLHPGSVWPTKRWPVPYFAEIGKRAVRHGAHVLLFAGPGEEVMAEQVLERISNDLAGTQAARVHSLAGKLGLAGLAAHIGRLSCYLTNDSGPMHLAWAQKVPVTALFGPTVRSLGFFPRGEHSSVMEVALSCRPCGLHGHAVCPRGHHDCMNLLLPDSVWPDVAAKLFTGGLQESS